MKWFLRLFPYVRDLEKRVATLTNQVHKDRLTKIWNAQGFIEAFTPVLEEARESQKASNRRHEVRCAAFMYIDLNGFKEINDTYGHDAGDMLLVSFVRALKKELRSTDIVGRWYAGDEFVVGLPHMCKEDALARVARIQKSLAQQKYSIGERNVSISAAFGVASTEENLWTIEALRKAAEERMYEEKESYYS